MNKDRFYGTLYGQAIGDALGLGTEFMTRQEVGKYYPTGLKQYDQIIQDAHRSRWEKGDWTDDTDMMLCIANALADNEGKVDLIKIAKNFKAWFNGTPMGIGRHTYNVLCMRDYTNDPIKAAEIIWTLYKKRSAANGGLMRTSVVGLLPLNQQDLIKSAEDICKLTHPDLRCVGSAVIASVVINNLVYHDKEMQYEEIVGFGRMYDERIEEFISSARNSSTVDELSLDGLDQGYTLKTLAAALWAYWHCNSFEEGLYAVVNAGGDADTNAAVACAILGAKYGFCSIPQDYVNGMKRKCQLNEIVSKLYSLYSKHKEPLRVISMTS